MYRPSGATHSALLLKTAALLPLAPPLFGLTLDDRNRVTAVASNSQVAGRARRRAPALALDRPLALNRPLALTRA